MAPDETPSANLPAGAEALLGAAVARLGDAGIENAPREARLLLNLALGVGANVLLAPEMAIPPGDADRFTSLIDRRAAREPYSRIVGRREFWSLPLLLSRDTLDPRPDSETLVEAVLARIPDRAAPLSILDFGTGTGALLLALLSELPNAQGVGGDLSPGAVETARRNAAALGLADRAGFALANWGLGLSGPVDVIVANPPYIPSEQLDALAPEVARFDPRMALDGGMDGLKAYRELAPDMARLLQPAGFAVCEIGAGQGPAVAEILARAGLETVAKQCDLAGIERCLVVEPRENVGKS